MGNGNYAILFGAGGLTIKVMTISISKKIIGYQRSPFIIAEAGVNHNGRLDLALKLVNAASSAGADAIKFQTFKAKNVATNWGKAKSHFEMLKKLELKERFYKPIIKRCREKNIIFLSTPHGGFESINFLQSLNVPAFKFGSGDLTNLPVLQYAAKFKKPMIIATGMANLEEIKEAINCIKKTGNNKIIVLHCTTNYPCPLDQANLRAMQTMKEQLDVLIGYSDHTLGIQVPIMAVTLGACLIEKHFTLDKNMSGPDHKASLEPSELKKMIEGIRNIEKVLGDGIKKPNPSEIKIARVARKSIVAAINIKRGSKITEEMLAIKRPGTGIEPKHLYRIIGKITKKYIKKDELIKWTKIS